MIIASPEFPLVFIPFLAAYWWLRRLVDIQKLLLLLFGYGLYTLLNPWFSIILNLFTGVIGLIADWIHRSDSPSWKRGYLAAGVSVGLALLLFFKYFNFFGQQVESGIRLLGLAWAAPVIDVLMPLGISFYVFQAISYLVSIFEGGFKPARPLDLALYLCFLPILLAGPICRPKELLSQLASTAPRRVEDPDRILLLICSFVIKKVWLASWLAASMVDPIFADPGAFNGFEVLIGAFAYAMQIYFDFSGYTDLATAIALLLGYSLPANFSLPYLSRSLSEFWGRWHISLSRWIRDYVYIPLGGSYHGLGRTLINLLVSMTLSGLWHGASTKYLIWGLFHGVGLCAEKLLMRLGLSRPGLLLTFLFVCGGWVFFRASSLDAALQYFRSCLDWSLPLSTSMPHLPVLLLLAICFLLWSQAERLLLICRRGLEQLPLVFRPLPVAAVITAALALAPDGMPSFIYAQF